MTKSDMGRKGKRPVSSNSLSPPWREVRAGTHTETWSNSWSRDHGGVLIIGLPSCLVQYTFWKDLGPPAQECQCPWCAGSSYVNLNQKHASQSCLQAIWLRRLRLTSWQDKTKQKTPKTKQEKQDKRCTLMPFKNLYFIEILKLHCSKDVIYSQPQRLKF